MSTKGSQEVKKVPKLINLAYERSPNNFTYLLEEDGTDEVRSLVVAAVEVDTKLLLSWIDLAG